MEDPTKAQVDAVLDSFKKVFGDSDAIAQNRPRTSVLPPLASMTWTDEEKQRLRTYGAQMVRFRVRRGWLSILKSWGKSGRT